VGSLQPGASFIDLRPDGGATLDGNGLNVCLLHLPLADSDARLRLVALDPQETLGPAVRNVIRSQLGLASLSQTRWQQIVEEVLTLPPVNRWKPLQVGRDGWAEIYLGGLFSRWKWGGAGALPASDNFNRANANPIGGNWTTGSGTADIQLLTNQVQGVGGDCAAYWNADAFNGDHYSQAVTPVANPDAAVLCRHQQTAWTAYFFDALGTPEIFFKIIGGSFTTLVAGGVAFAIGDVAKIDANGSTITAYKNGASVKTATDTAIVGGSAAIFCFGNSTANVLDDWQGNNLGAAAAAVWNRQLRFANKIRRQGSYR